MSPRDEPLPVLVVEDDASTAELARRSLARAKHAVRAARRVDEALRLLSEERFRVAILDYRLEDGIAWPVLDAARAAAPPLPVIVVTSAGDERVAAEAIRRGAADYVVKSGDCWAGLPAIVDRVAREAASASENALLASVVQYSQDAIVAGSLDGQVMSWNPAAERIFGWRAEEMIGRSAAVLFPPDRRSELERMREVVVHGGVASVESVRRRRDGTCVDVFETVSPIRDRTGAVVGVAVVVHDITERKALEAEYRHAQKMEAVGRLAGGVAHDFNNLLTVINGYGEMVLAHLAAEDSLRPHVVEICRAGERAAALTQQLLTFSRKQITVPRVLGVNGLVDGLVALLRRLIGDDIELTVASRAAPDLVFADPGQIEQVIVNLAVNARDAMPRGGRLTISTRYEHLVPAAAGPAGERSGPHVVLSVADTGVGMTADVIPRIFEPFFTTKAAGAGTGLGLATVHGIAAQCGGSVQVDSAPGRGSRFDVYLPAADPAGSSLPPRADAGSTHGGRASGTILVADDDDAVRGLVRDVLEAAGFSVIDARNGDEALELAASVTARIDALVTDVVMRGMSGPDLAERLAERRPGVPVLYISGYADVAEGRLTPGANFLEKPFTAALLVRRVRDLLPR